MTIATDTGGFGNLVFEKKQSARTPLVMLLSGLFFLLISAGIWWQVLSGQWPWVGLRTFFGLFGAGPLGALFIGAAVLLVVRGSDAISVYERGARNQRRGKSVAIAFDEVTSCFYHEHCWNQLGTATLELFTEDGRTLKVLHDFSPSGMKGQEELETARDVARRVVALVQRRMESALNRGETVEWLEGWNLHANGLKRATDGKTVAWDKIDRAQFTEESEKWYCTIAGKLKIDVDSENFWPGYAILRHRVHEARGISLDPGALG